MSAWRRLSRQFWATLDDEKVAIWQYVGGAFFILAGVNGIFLAGGQAPLTMRGSMSHLDITLWYGLNIAGPLVSLIGKALHGRLSHAGMLMQLAGDVAIVLFLLAYVTGTVRVEPLGSGGYGAFLAEGAFLCAVLLVARDIRRLRKVERFK